MIEFFIFLVTMLLGIAVSLIIVAFAVYFMLTKPNRKDKEHKKQEYKLEDQKEIK